MKTLRPVPQNRAGFVLAAALICLAGRAQLAQSVYSGPWLLTLQVKGGNWSTNETEFDLLVSLKNESDRQLWVLLTNPYREYRFSVTDPFGKPVSMTPRGREIVKSAGDIRTRSGRMPIASKKSAVSTTDLHQLYDEDVQALVEG